MYSLSLSMFFLVVLLLPGCPKHIEKFSSRKHISFNAHPRFLLSKQTLNNSKRSVQHILSHKIPPAIQFGTHILTCHCNLKIMAHTQTAQTNIQTPNQPTNQYKWLLACTSQNWHSLRNYKYVRAFCFVIYTIYINTHTHKMMGQIQIVMW